VLVSVIGTSACLAISTMCSSVGQANFVAIIFLIYCMMFGGLFLSNETGGPGQYLRRLSFFNYAYEALCGNEFADMDMIFNAKGLPAVAIEGDYLLSNFGMSIATLGTNMNALWIYWAAFFLLGLASFVLFNGSPKEKTMLQKFRASLPAWSR
jgi:hypothetical protein